MLPARGRSSKSKRSPKKCNFAILLALMSATAKVANKLEIKEHLLSFKRRQFEEDCKMYRTDGIVMCIVYE